MRKLLLPMLVFVFSAMGVYACSNPPTGGDEKPSTEKTVTKDGGTKDGGTKDDGTKDGGGNEGTVAKDDAPKDEAPKDEKPPEPNPNTGKSLWSVTLTGSVNSIALSADEKQLYVGATGFTVLDAENGDEVWSYSNPTYGQTYSTPVVGSNGLVYAGTDGKFLVYFDPKSKRLAGSTKLQDEGHNFSPAIDKKGIVYIAAGKKVYAFQGRTDTWGKGGEIPGGAASAPALAPDGTLYVCGKDKQFYAFKSDGSLKWNKNVGRVPCHDPSVDADGTVYVGADKLYAFKPDGSARFLPEGKYGEITTTIVIYQEYLYFGTFKGKIFKVKKADGQKVSGLWEDGYTAVIAGSLDYAPTIGAGGLIYIGHGAPGFDALRPDRPRALWSLQLRNVPSGYPTINKKGVLFIGTEKGTIFAVQTDSQGLASSPWPRGLQNNRNTGQLR